MKPGITSKMLVGVSLAVFVGALSACQVVSDELQVISDELETLAVGGPEAEVKKCFDEYAERRKLRYENLTIITATSTEEETVVFTLCREKDKGTGKWQNWIGRTEVENYRGQWSIDALQCLLVLGEYPASVMAWNLARGISPRVTYDEWLALAAKDSYAREVLEQDIIMTIVGYVEEGDLELSQIKDSRLRERVQQLVHQ